MNSADAEFLWLVARPSALLLWPALVLAWWLSRRRAPRRTVGSLEPWRAIDRSGRARPPLLLWLAFAAFALAAARPERVPVPIAIDPRRDSVHLIPPERGSRVAMVEAILAPGPDTSSVQIVVGDTVVETREISRKADAPVPLTHRVDLPADDAPLRSVPVQVTIDGRRWPFTLSVPPAPIEVDDRTRSASVSRALSTLAEAGWISLSRASGTDPKPPDLIVTRGALDRNALAGPTPSIVIPDPDSDLTALLPRIAAPLLPHPIGRGLALDRWSILERRATPTNGTTTIVLDSSAGPLIEVGSRAAWLHFDPDASDVANDPRWPILWGRLVEWLHEESGPFSPPTTERESGALAGRGPQRILTALGIILLVLATGRRSARTLAAIIGTGAIVAALLPDLATDPPTNAIDGAPENIVERARSGHGELLTPIPGTEKLPIDPEAISRLLRARSNRYEATFEAPGVRVEPSVVRVGEEARWIIGADVKEAELVRPDGTAEPLAAGSRRFETPGVWSVRIGGRPVPVGLLVRPPLRVTVLGPADAASSLFPPGDPRWQIERRSPSDELDLPPIESGLVVVHGDDPSLATPDAFRRLSDWVGRGGAVLFAGATGHEDPALRTALSELAGVELPPPPREREPVYGVVLLDLSGSLRGAPLETLVRGVEALLAGTPVGGRWGVAGFRDRADWIVPPGTSVGASLIEQIREFEATGGTRLDRALDFIEREWSSEARDRTGAERDGGKTLVILSDGRVGSAGAIDWHERGAALASRGVEVITIGIGPAPSPDPLALLAAGASGRNERVVTPSEASALLESAAEPPPSRDIAFAEYVAPASAHPWLTGLRGQLPAPQRGVDLTTTDARPLLIDARGRVALSGRSFGAGRAITWHGDWQTDSLPLGPARERLLDGVQRIIANALAETARPARDVHRRWDVDGRAWLVARRLPGEPATLLARWRGQEERLWIAAGREYRLRLPDAATDATHATDVDGGPVWLVAGAHSITPGPDRGTAEVWIEGPPPVARITIGAEVIERPIDALAWWSLPLLWLAVSRLRFPRRGGPRHVAS